MVRRLSERCYAVLGGKIGAAVEAAKNLAALLSSDADVGGRAPYGVGHAHHSTEFIRQVGP